MGSGRLCSRLSPKGVPVRKVLVSVTAAASILLAGCGSVSGPDVPSDPETTPVTTSAPTEDPDPAPTTTPETGGTETGGTQTGGTEIPPEEQSPAEATAVDGSMSVALPDDWRYAPELETPYSVFAWTKEDGTQNLSMAPLGPWAQISSPESYLDELQANGNLEGAEAVLEGDTQIDGYDGFWMSVAGPGYVANIYYINVDGGIKEITANALHTQGLAEIDRLVETIDFH